VNDGKMPDWQKTFRNELENMISSIFDGKGYFEQTTEIENCRYCPFLQMCSRIVPENPY
jgi:sulfatase maturation enzyme AslB (radical SAM superfamily)